MSSTTISTYGRYWPTENSFNPREVRKPKLRRDGTAFKPVNVCPPEQPTNWQMRIALEPYRDYEEVGRELGHLGGKKDGDLYVRFDLGGGF